MKLSIIEPHDLSYCSNINHEYFDNVNINLVIKEIKNTNFSFFNLIPPKDKGFLNIKPYLYVHDQIKLWGEQLKAEHDRTVRRELKKLGYSMPISYHGLGYSTFFIDTRKSNILIDYFDKQITAFKNSSTYFKNPFTYSSNSEAENEGSFAISFLKSTSYNNVQPTNDHLSYSSILSFLNLEILFHIQTNITEKHLEAFININKLRWPIFFDSVLHALMKLTNHRALASYTPSKTIAFLPKTSTSSIYNNLTPKIVLECVFEAKNYLNLMIENYRDIFLFNPHA